MLSFTPTSSSNKTFHCFREELFDRVMPFDQTRENCRRKICDSVTHNLPEVLLLSYLFSFLVTSQLDSISVSVTSVNLVFRGKNPLLCENILFEA